VNFDSLLMDLKARVPAELNDAFQDALASCRVHAIDGPGFLDAIDTMHTNLGIAIGRGTTGQEQRYEQLGRVVSWLYEELGQPQNTSYAVVARAVKALHERERKDGED